MIDDAERRELLGRIGALRVFIHEEIGAAALRAEPSKACARVGSALSGSRLPRVHCS